MTKKPPQLTIFVTLTGRYLAGSIRKRVQGKIYLDGACFVEIAADQARFIFSPIKFAPRFFRLYESGLLGDTDMPEIMQPGYLEYLETLSGNKAKKKRK